MGELIQVDVSAAGAHLPRRKTGGRGETDLGEVNIALSAIETLVTKVARGIKGVRDVRSTVYSRDGGIGVRVRGVVSPEVNVPETARAIQQAVTDYTKNVVGVDVTEVKVLVQNITNETRARRVE